MKFAMRILLNYKSALILIGLRTALEYPSLNLNQSGWVWLAPPPPALRPAGPKAI